MRCIIFFSILINFLTGNTLCDLKKSTLEASLQIASEKQDTDRIKELKDKIHSLNQHCNNQIILKETEDYINSLQSQMSEKKHILQEKQLAKEGQGIRELKLEIELLHQQIIAAKQELLRLKDKIK